MKIRTPNLGKEADWTRTQEGVMLLADVNSTSLGVWIFGRGLYTQSLVTVLFP